MVTLAEYVDRMPESQKYIYFAAGENAAAMDHLPQTEVFSFLETRTSSTASPRDSLIKFKDS